MMTEWVTFFLSMLCCQCLDGMPALSNSSGRDSISCYKMLSDHSTYLEAGETVKRQIPYSDTEVQLRNHNPETSQEELEVTYSSEETTGGPSIYIEQACGEPRGQQLVVDFSPQAGDAEIELRNQVYDLDSSSMDATSESEPGLVQARGDHMKRAQYRASRYANGSETEVVIKTFYPEYESSSTVSRGRDTSSVNETLASKQKLHEPRGQPQSSPELKTTNQSIVATVAVVNQHPFKDPTAKSNQPITSAADQIWEFQSCFSSPMAVFRRTDPLWKAQKPDKSSVQNDSEIELKSHLYTFVTSSAEDMVAVQKEVEQKPLIKAPIPALKVPRTPEKDNNFPTIHKARNQGSEKIPEDVVQSEEAELTMRRNCHAVA